MQPVPHPTHAPRFFDPTLVLGAFLALALAPTLASGAATENEWPGWRGLNYEGSSTQEGVFSAQGTGLKVAWKRKLGSGYSAISVAGGRALTMFSDGEADFLIALSAHTGEELWRHRIDSTFPGRDGATDGPTSTPLIDGDRIYAIGPRGQLLAVDAKTGKTSWSTHLVDDHGGAIPHWGFTTSPLVYGDLLIVATGGSENNAITAFNKETGERIWSGGDDTVSYQSPLVAQIGGRTQLLYSGDTHLHGLDPESGAERWNYPHDGSGFFQKMLNPVVIDGDRLLLKHRGSEAKAVRIIDGEDGVRVEELWSSQDFKRNQNIPIAHQGFIYGYSRDFLICIDATSGELVWKSREPGNGFLGLVDSHLVIMTKRGSVHVAKATPEGYREVASLKLFDRLTWTPPSFAQGQIFVRSSYDEIASVEVLRGSAHQVASQEPKRFTIPSSDFHKFVRRVESSPDKSALIDKFIAEQRQFPILEGERWVHLVYRGPAQNIFLGGDLFEAFETVPMHRIEGTDFFYASFELEPDASVNYFFEKDLEGRMPDPLNERKTPSPAFYYTEISEIRMPRHVSPAHLEEPTGGRGRLEDFNFTSKIQEGPRAGQVYLPRGYDEGAERYPVLYVHYGEGALSAGKLANTLDNLIGERIQPLIVVLLNPVNGYEYARSQKDGYARMLVEEIVPLIDAKYRTIARAGGRAIMGGDEGGYGALYAGFKHPGVFGMIAAQSPLMLSDGDEELFALIEKAAAPKVRAYVDWGKYDYRNPNREDDVGEFGRLVAQHLARKGHDVVYGEENSGAGFASWRLRADRILEMFFSLEELKVDG